MSFIQRELFDPIFQCQFYPKLSSSLLVERSIWATERTSFVELLIDKSK